MAKRTYYDPLHQGITLDDKIPEEEMIIGLIDSSPFQRLRRIKQLGPASLTFHGAESSRFTHSLGVFHIARRALKKLLKLEPELIQFKGLLYASSLLHDIGHGPLSHTSEGMFGLNHEEWSFKVIKEHPEITNILNKLKSSLSLEVSNLFRREDTNHKLIKTLVSSQLDCDRLDYLMRDSHSSGTHYGQIDLERILSALTIAPDGDLAINPKGLLAVEHYLVVRNLMYRSIYNHRLNEVCNWLLEKIIELARQLGPKAIWADSYFSTWLWNPKKINIETFLANDDVRTIYHLSRWKDEAPQPLRGLCECFLNRKLPKAINIEDLKVEFQLEALSITKRLTEELGKDSNIYCGLRHNKIYGYEPYKKGLRLWDGENLKALEKESLLIERLISPSKNTWLIYPKEINSSLKKKLSKLRQTQKI
ncbi:MULTISPECIES: HD domain-containing protein [Prochlorococcus]|uniref:HD superfamily phosphohydrolase n=1 Tax=Prochlorococcus marinus (strain SARG / CCMP1375 / SS120) TaxID=167539 RepID=Q7VDL1_PROMA|nr:MULTISPECIES: HD domain-containing protein [Prochlorococcus]AAP99411.1 HD superfamily phosphohydrolase [Prochlorococcus marinus subsp. marinus str. CCMP1375]KGG11321.1 putative dNTP triphosphohydrolase [Prochlorococcus marinus str. LG]KGG18724.1 putative dNTP triphosphohydrolase [Prochlorococcus marinus str. SS2]KGG22998.1 putative dNTP triphosphohydrolase [Prochlorococcus marinus str. SS35]KGG34101.1 putative dNTP triphosphohydrolase [Prochlorococcus marinus str. SS51]